jgi:hypothetical protein
MNAIAWLVKRADGLGDLSVKERALISEFSVLWTYFEAKLLGGNANAKSIVDLARAIVAAGKLDTERLKEVLSYFRHRYVKEGKFTHHFAFLNLRGNDNPNLVKNMLLDNEKDPSNLLASALIIVLRYRNNLFHGLKWAYGVRGQRKNFEAAISLLIATLEMHGTE